MFASTFAPLILCFCAIAFFILGIAFRRGGRPGKAHAELFIYKGSKIAAVDTRIKASASAYVGKPQMAHRFICNVLPVKLCK